MPLARRIVADPQGGIWLGLASGDLAHLRNGRLSTVTFGHHANSRVRAITVASDGSILGSTAFGVVGWNNGKQQILTVQNGLPCDTVNTVISDDAGNLWLYAQCGLIEIPKQQMQLWWEHPESKLSLRLFDILDGAEGGWAPFNSSAKTSDGRLWFTNSSVVQVIDPARIPENSLPPPVDISVLVADRKAYPLESAIHLPPRTRDLEIDYTALSFAAPQKVLFRYVLEGHDAGWQEPGTRRQAFYNDLRPGAYRFRVIACNNDGVWNEAGAFLDFSILPAYYQTTWFRSSCAVAFLVLLWCAYQLRVRQLQRKFAGAVEVRVNERTRIARELHDTLLQSLHGLLMSFQRAANLLPERPVEAKLRLEGAIDEAAQAITEGREAVQGLRSSTTVTNDLALAIQTLGEELAAKQTTQNPPLFNVAVEGTSRDLNPILRDDVYRIAGEALRNAFQHGQAKRIEVEIHYDERQLRVRIRDDGKGLSPEVFANNGRAGHWGLQGMRERAKLVGGHLEIWSELDSGTEIELRIPASIAYLTTAPTIEKT
jgi:signal transduction histidine kinase